MTGRVSLSHITFLGYQNASRHYRDVVATHHNVMRCVVINVVIRPTSQHVVTMTFRQKRRFPPSFPIVLSRRPNVTTHRKLNQSNHNVVITSQLHRDYVTMYHNVILTSWYVVTCVAIWKKLKKPNLIIINWVFSWFYKVLYVSYAEFWAQISRDICIKQFCLDWKIFKKYMFRTRCCTEDKVCLLVVGGGKNPAQKRRYNT